MPAVSDSNSSSDEEDVYEVERIVDHKLMVMHAQVRITFTHAITNGTFREMAKRST
jgi:hypothetical protein